MEDTSTMHKMILAAKFQLLLKAVCTTIITFFLPIYPAMIAVGILIFIDTITGIIGAKRSGEPITSKKMGTVITKSIVYQLLIVSAHLCETFLFEQIPFVKISIAFLAMTEFTSIAENFQKATGKNFIKYIKTLLDTKFRGIITEASKDIPKDIDKEPS